MMKNKNKIILGLSLVFSFSAFSVHADEVVKDSPFKMRVITKEKFNDEKETGRTQGAWTNTGGIHTCSTWSPDTGTVNWGDSFLQSRDCDQDQTRPTTILMYDEFFKKSFEVPGPDEYRTVRGPYSQNNNGTWERWISASTHYGGYVTYQHRYSGYSPSPSGRASHTQTRTRYDDQRRLLSYRQQHTRTGEYRTTSTAYQYRTLTYGESRWVNTYHCPGHSSYGYKSPWSGCSKR